MNVLTILKTQMNDISDQMLKYFPDEIIRTTDSLNDLVKRVLHSALVNIDLTKNVKSTNECAILVLLAADPVNLRNDIVYEMGEIDDNGNVKRRKIISPQIMIYWIKEHNRLYSCVRFPDDIKGETIEEYWLDA